MERGYSDETHALIERMCRNVEDKNLIVDKPKAEELILKTYDIFGLKRPSEIVWCVDIFDSQFEESAGSAMSAWSVGSAGSALSAWSVGSARSAMSAMSAWSVGSAGSALSAWSAMSAWSVGSAGSAMSAWSAMSALSTRSAGSVGSAGSALSVLDYDFDWFIFEYEYIKNHKDNPGEEPNENDYKYLEYCELLMQAKEAGLGYRAEWEDILYLVPTPIVRLNNNTPPQFHSDQEPAIEWRNGSKFYFLDGVKFEKDLWDKVVSKQMTFDEIMKIEISDQRTVALKYNPEAIIKSGAKLIHSDDRNNELYLVENSEVNKIVDAPKMWFLKMKCPTGRVFTEGVEPEFAERHQNATECQAELCGLTKSEYADMIFES